MQNPRFAVQQIKNTIKMPELLRHYGIDVGKNRRISCPFHNGKDKNCSIKEDYMHCFVCGESADQISFVQKLFSLSFQDALKKIDADFGLNIYKSCSFEDLRRSMYTQKALKAKKEREKEAKRKAEDEYWSAFKEWKRLEDNIRLYKPKTPLEEPHPLFVESLQKLEQQKHVVDFLNDRRLSL